MCGIIGVIGHSKVSSLLIEGLKRLEYRGYDSAGIATLLNGRIDRRRSLGKIENLKKLRSGEFIKPLFNLSPIMIACSKSLGLRAHRLIIVLLIKR